jgi:hypothetical protein
MPRLIGLMCALAIIAAWMSDAFLRSASLQAAEPAAAKAAAKELLEKGWDKTAAARALADGYDLGSKELTGDYRVALAHWLVLMYHNKYDKALDSLKVFFECTPPAGARLIGLRAKAWLHTTKREYSDALTTAAGLAAAVSPDPQAAASTIPASHAEVIEFLGHLAGFLEGPAQKTSDQNARKRFEAAVLAKFDEPRKKVFQDAKAEVLSEYQKLVGEAAEAKQDTKAAAEAAKQQNLEKLSEESQRLSSDTSKVADEQKQLRDEFMTKMSALEREDIPLRNQLIFQQNSLTVAMTGLNRARANAQGLSTQMRGEKDNARRRQLEGDYQRAQNDVLANERQVDFVNGQIRMTNGQRIVLQNRANALIAEAKVKGFQLENQLQDIDREKAKNENKQKKAERAKSGPSSKALSRETEARAFTTYDTFPLDDVREILLNSVK